MTWLSGHAGICLKVGLADLGGPFQLQRFDYSKTTLLALQWLIHPPYTHYHTNIWVKSNKSEVLLQALTKPRSLQAPGSLRGSVLNLAELQGALYKSPHCSAAGAWMGVLSGIWPCPWQKLGQGPLVQLHIMTQLSHPRQDQGGLSFSRGSWSVLQPCSDFSSVPASELLTLQGKGRNQTVPLCSTAGLCSRRGCSSLWASLHPVNANQRARQGLNWLYRYFSIKLYIWGFFLVLNFHPNPPLAIHAMQESEA